MVCNIYVKSKLGLNYKIVYSKNHCLLSQNYM